MRIRPPAFATASIAATATPTPSTTTPAPMTEAYRDELRAYAALEPLDRDDPPAPGSRRADGWTADRQRLFLAALAEGATVEGAARHVGLSVSSAYAFRQRAHGAAFALGWHAALLLQRQKLADTLTARAFDGQVDTYTRADGTEVTRHRHDNRLGLALLTRLDRLAARDEGADTHGEAQAMRIVAGEWQRYLDLIAAGGTPAQAGLFLTARAPAAAPAAGADPVAALAPVLSLARADLYLRTGCGDVGEIDIADLDPAARADWTADQWRRAEAAGLLALAPAPVAAGAAGNPPHPQHSPDPATAEEDDDLVWYDEARDEWRTVFPPPPGHYPSSEGERADGTYSRALTAAEAFVVEPIRAEEEAAEDAAAQAQRRAWFAARQPRFDPEAPLGADWLDFALPAPADRAHAPAEAGARADADARADARADAATRADADARDDADTRDEADAYAPADARAGAHAAPVADADAHAAPAGEGDALSRNSRSSPPGDGGCAF